ncbi:MAG: hypothetical protein HFE73_04065 [Firmicutes bacterium]|nr:hypothetical protein [Bacillota bacterium]
MEENNTIKEIRLIPDEPFHNNVDLAICDFGGPEGALRQRGKITVDFAEADVNQLKEQGIDTMEKAMDYYQDKIYRTVRRYLLTEFALVADSDQKKEEGGIDAMAAKAGAAVCAAAAKATNQGQGDMTEWMTILKIVANHIGEYYESV